MAKSLGGGLPIGAAVYPVEMDFRESGKHSNTFGGNPVACAASLATLDVIEDEGLVARSAKIGQHLAHSLAEVTDRDEFVGDGPGTRGLQAMQFAPDKR